MNRTPDKDTLKIGRTNSLSYALPAISPRPRSTCPTSKALAFDVASPPPSRLVALPQYPDPSGGGRDAGKSAAFASSFFSSRYGAIDSQPTPPCHPIPVPHPRFFAPVASRLISSCEGTIQSPAITILPMWLHSSK